MENEELFRGFDHDFFVDDEIKIRVPFPSLSKNRISDLAPVKYKNKSSIDYLNFSVQLSESRKFPIFTASNIDGQLFKKASRAPSWKKDKRVLKYQWGQELYDAEKSDFDKGHMTKREDVQWGMTSDLAKKAADSTFYYTNAVPQHKELNQQIWKSLEDYILYTETRKKSLKICVFTGPVLSNNDPEFTTEVNGEKILLPTVFWKVVLFPKEDGKLYRVGFMMSQKKLLVEHGIVEKTERGVPSPEDKIFMQFEDAATYQVNISLIEQLTELKIPKAVDSYTDNRSMKLVLDEIDVDPAVRSLTIEKTPGFSISNIVL
jgi:endonuclease G, mitochondrial